MADRRRQIVQLLASRYDRLYLPPGSLTTRAGLVPAELEPCGSCGGVLLRDDYGKTIRRRKGRGWILDAFKRRQPCTACAGEGEIARDPMDAQHVRVGSTSTAPTARPRQRKTCDRCNGAGVWKGARCELCDGDGRRDVHVFDLHIDTREPGDDPLDQAIEQRNESGSYAELERALVGIVHHVNKPVRYRWLTDNAVAAVRLLDEITIAGRDDSTLTPVERALFDLAVAYIDSRMPAEIKVPAEVRANAREQREWRKRVKGRAASNGAIAKRDTDVRALIRRGVPTQRVAFEYGLSVSQVNRIVKGDAA